MLNISQKQQKILSIILRKGRAKSSEIHTEMNKNGVEVSLVTVKRAISEMVDIGLLFSTGTGRATSYEVAIVGRMLADISAGAYCAIEPDKRYGSSRYNFKLFSELPDDIFTADESDILDKATIEYHRRTADIPEAIQKKELERLVIEFSWKSSKIEGNTYTLLDTERLILEHKEASGHDQREAIMILNHKDAFTFVYENAAQFTMFTRTNLEKLHAILVRNLSVGLGLRKKPVGVLGSIYQPLDNIYQITEAVEALAHLVSKMSTPYAKALVALLGISYIQPFEDGNKRTARLMANALLLAHRCAPLSYRSVDENEYRASMIVFYELNSIVPFKKIFVGQYDFAARNYVVK